MTGLETKYLFPGLLRLGSWLNRPLALIFYSRQDVGAVIYNNMEISHNNSYLRSEYYRWRTGVFGNCSVTCGGGVMSRTVACIQEVTLRSNETLPLPDVMCGLPAPLRNRSCNTNTCATFWWTGEWSQVRCEIQHDSWISVMKQPGTALARNLISSLAKFEWWSQKYRHDMSWIVPDWTAETIIPVFIQRIVRIRPYCKFTQRIAELLLPENPGNALCYLPNFVNRHFRKKIISSPPRSLLTRSFNNEL